MTKTLTEQWRDKELKDGDYYVLNKRGHIVCDYYIEILGHFDGVLTENVKEVLAPVPSYDDIVKLEKKLAIATKALKDYANSDEWELVDSKNVYWSRKRFPYPWRIAGKALKEMESVE